MATTLCATNVSASAGAILPDSSYENWAGFVNELALPDGSTLYEYSAQTTSGDVEGAMLSVSFIPRFNCHPTVYLRLPSDYWPEDSDSVLLLDITFNQKNYQYPALIDEEPGFRTYSISTDINDLDDLRELVDYSVRASFQPAQGSESEEAANGKSSSQAISEPADSADAPASVKYSLIGSRRAVKATELYCEQHKPVPFTAQ